MNPILISIGEIISDISIMISILIAVTLVYALFIVKISNWIYYGKLKKRPRNEYLILGYLTMLFTGFYIWQVIIN